MALIDLCFERGFAALTVEALCRRAALTRQEFARRYRDLEDCFLHVCGTELDRCRRNAAAARAGLRDWDASLRASAYALYRFLAEDERRCRFTLVEPRHAGGRLELLFSRQVDDLSGLIDAGRAEPAAPATLTLATAQSLAGAVLNQLSFLAGRGGPLPPEHELVPKFLYAAVLPYRGPSAAAEELRIPAPPRAPAA